MDEMKKENNIIYIKLKQLFPKAKIDIIQKFAILKIYIELDRYFCFDYATDVIGKTDDYIVKEIADMFIGNLITYTVDERNYQKLKEVKQMDYKQLLEKVKQIKEEVKNKEHKEILSYVIIFINTMEKVTQSNSVNFSIENKKLEDKILNLTVENEHLKDIISSYKFIVEQYEKNLNSIKEIFPKEYEIRLNKLKEDEE